MILMIYSYAKPVLKSSKAYLGKCDIYTFCGIFAPLSLTPGMAHCWLSLLCIAMNSKTGLPSSFITSPFLSLFHLQEKGWTEQKKQPEGCKNNEYLKKIKKFLG